MKGNIHNLRDLKLQWPIQDVLQASCGSFET